jgi:hypothetical protein
VANGPLLDEATRQKNSVTGSSQRRAATTVLPEFQPMRVEINPPLSPPVSEPEPSFGGISSEPFSLFNPALEALASLTAEDFRTIFAHSPIKRVKYRGWLRNLCVAMGNSRDRRFIAWLEEAAQHPDALVREHADWALRQLQTAV